MRGYHFLISASYPYPLKTIRISILSVQTLLTAIRILSVSVILLWYNYTASQKNFPRHFRLYSFNDWLLDFNSFFGTGIPDLTQHQTMAFHFPPHLTLSSALPGKQTSTTIACLEPGSEVRRVQPKPRPSGVARNLHWGWLKFGSGRIMLTSVEMIVYASFRPSDRPVKLVKLQILAEM